jgi:hypothetical protein
MRRPSRKGEFANTKNLHTFSNARHARGSLYGLSSPTLEVPRQSRHDYLAPAYLNEQRLRLGGPCNIGA